ncbi:MAG: DUF91 domain-containing protein [Candidatus Altiarchaeota archaeon]|nr:DUF91 domain-containing protein [Candidatus Altiarchaeota archaeon]
MISQELCDRINRDLGDRRFTLIVCDCSIEYYGRSRSEIGRGHRMIVVKPDTTILIHSLSGFKPVNWMSPPTETIAEYEKELLLHSQRTKKPYEEIKIRIHDVLDYRAYANLIDDGRLDITHTEKDLQDYLVSHPKLVHPEFRLKKAEYQTPLGFFDLYGKIGDKYVVVELKAEKAGLPAALQVKRYVEWLKQHVKPVQGMLMAPGITANALTILRKEGIEFKKIDVRKIYIKHKKNKTLGEWC